MKKIIITLTILCSAILGVYAQKEGKGIIFAQGTFNETLRAAQKANKLVFIDCYTSWCGPCKMMDKYVFTNDTVAAYFNKNFVNYKMDMEKGEGIGVRREYRVSSYPTYLFLDGTGKVVHQSKGRMPAADFIAVAQKASNPTENSLVIEDRYAAGDRSPELLLKYLKTINVNKAKRIFQENLANVSDEVLKTDTGWEIIKFYPLDEQDRFYKFLKANEAYFVSKYGKEEVKKIYRQVELTALYRALGKNETEELFKRLASYRQDADEAMLRTAAKIEVLHYLNIKDYPGFIKIAKQYSGTVLKRDDETLNFIARRCAITTDDKAVLQQALAMAKQAVMINDKAYTNQRSYADVCYKMGLKDEALKSAEIAYQLIAEDNPKAGDQTKELIEKIKAM